MNIFTIVSVAFSIFYLMMQYGKFRSDKLKTKPKTSSEIKHDFESISNSLYFCERCGTILGNDAAYCYECGKKRIPKSNKKEI